MGFIGYRHDYFMGEEEGLGSNGFGIRFAPEELVIGLELGGVLTQSSIHSVHVVAAGVGEWSVGFSNSMWRLAGTCVKGISERISARVPGSISTFSRFSGFLL